MSVLDEVEKLKQEQASKTEGAITTTEPQEEGYKPLAPAIQGEKGEDVVTQTVQQAMVKKVKEGAENDMRGLVRDMTYVKGASDLQGDEDFRVAYQDELGKQIIQDLKDEGRRAAIVEQSKKQQAKNLRDESFYNGCKPVFTLLGIEAAYGLVPMIITVVLLMVPFLVVSLIRFVINSVNSIFTAIAGFKKPAFWICTLVIYLVITAAVVLGALWAIDYFFGTHIINIAKDAAGI